MAGPNGAQDGQGQGGRHYCNQVPDTGPCFLPAWQGPQLVSRPAPQSLVARVWVGWWLKGILEP